MTDESKPIARQSEMALFYLCGEAHRREYIERHEMPMPTAAVRGSALHRAVEANHREKFTMGRDLPTDTLMEISDEVFDRIVGEEGVYLSPDERRTGLTPVLARAKRDARESARVYSQQFAREMNPVDVEAKILADIDGSPVRLRGTVDQIQADLSVDDIKTTVGRGWGQVKADNSMQFGMYGILVRAWKGSFPPEFRIRQVNPRTGKTATFRTTRSRRDYRIFVSRLNAMLVAKEAGVFAPASLDSWFCSPTYCKWFESCPYVNSDRWAAAMQKGPI
jgi:RecB family exonuclease